MKLTDNKTRSITFRITPEDYKYLQAVAFMSGQNVSKFLRLLIDSTVNAAKLQEKKGALNLEDFEALCNDKLQHS